MLKLSTDDPVEKAGWTKVPNLLMCDNRISPTAKLVLISIMSYSFDGVCSQTKEIIKHNLSMGRTTVQKALNELEDKGYIERDTRWIPMLRKKVSVILTRQTHLRCMEVLTQTENEDKLTYQIQC